MFPKTERTAFKLNTFYGRICTQTFVKN